MQSRRSFGLPRQLAAAFLVASVLVGAPVAVAADKPDLSDAPSSKPNRNTSDGSVSEIGKALASARKSEKRVEVISERDATRTVFANPDGTVTESTALAPVRAKDADGKYVPIDLDLTERGKRLAPKIIDTDVSFSADGAGPVSRLDIGKGRSIELSLDQALEAPKVDGGTARYQVVEDRDATSPGDDNVATKPDVTASPTPSAEPTAEAQPTPAEEDEGVAPSLHVGTVARGFVANVELAEAPSGDAVYRFVIKADGLKVVLKGQQLLFFDGDDVVARSRALQMWDANVDGAGDPLNVADVGASLEPSGSDYVLELRPSMKYLQSPERKYPVTIDPTISIATKRDTFYFSNQAAGDTSHTDDFNLRVGSDDGTRTFRSVVVFKYNRLIGQVIDQATLKLKQYSTGSPGCVDQPTNFFPITNKVPVYPTWADPPTFSTDFRWKTTASFNTAATPGCSGGAGTVGIDIAPMVRGWAGEQQNKNPGPPPSPLTGGPEQGVVLSAPSSTAMAQEKRFCSVNYDSTTSYCKTASVVPTLDVVTQPELGTQSWFSTTDHSLNDHSSLSVNNRSGNAVVSTKDASINGIGLDLNLQRTYNAQATLTNTTLGTGWQFNIGPDVYLEKKDQYRFNFHGPSGTVLGSFTRESADSSDTAKYNNFVAPTGGVGADLKLINPGDGLTLTFRKSRMTYVFGEVDSNGNAYLTKIKDRNGNQITMAYSGTAGTRPKWTTITDASNRSYTVTYTGNTITKIATAAEAGVGVREWNFSYTSGQLTGYTDAQGNNTTYAYTSGLLTTITSPGTTVGSNEASIVYGSLQKVTEVYYRFGAGTDDRYKYTWTYSTGLVPACESNGISSTVVADPTMPTGKKVTHCFGERDDDSGQVKVWVYDDLDHKQSTEYSADNGPTNITAPSGTGATGSTVVAYGGTAFTDRINSITEPKNVSSNSASSTGFVYGTPATVQGNDYLPSASKSATKSECTKYNYNAQGLNTDTFAGVPADESGNCGSSTSATSEGHRQYNDNGSVEKAWDGNAGSSTPGDDDATIYTYWKSTAIDGSSFVPGSQWQVKSIRKPGGDCSTGSARKLCTSYTYDGAGRVLTITDGRGLVSTYAYDKNDRTTSVLFNGATQFLCDLNLGTGCFNYTYDGEGNLTSRKTDLGTTSYVFDRLNRMSSQSTPIAGGGSDSISMAYDGTGNLTSYSQLPSGASAWHTVDYRYDGANRLDRVTEGGENIGIASDADGRTQSVTFPKATSSDDGSRVEYDYYQNGRPKEMRLEKHSGTVVGKVGYDYTAKPFPTILPNLTVDSPLLQKRTVTTSPYADQQSTIAYKYDNKQQLREAKDQKSGQPDYTYTYDYDKVGNLKKEVAGSTTTFFGYNKAGQLCWKGPDNETTTSDYAPRVCSATPTVNDDTVASDASGNSLGVGTGVNSQTVNNRNQVTNVDGLAMTYQDQGNDIRAGIGTNREITGPLGVTAVSAGGSSVLYLVRDPSGTILSYRFGTQKVNYVTEPNGNVIWLTYPSGYVTAGYKYAPYGKAKVFGEQDSPETNKTVANNNRYRWLGAAQNLTSGGDDGNYKLGARYYDAQSHFTQPDPVAGGLTDPRTLTSYNYGGGDPINRSDASGYFAISIDAKVCVALCAGGSIGYDFDGGGLSGSVSGGFGLGGGVSVSGSPGGRSPGLSPVTTSCSAGPFSATAEAGGDSSVGFSPKKSLRLSCDSLRTYTF